MTCREGGCGMSELEFKLKSFKIEPQTTVQALENIHNLKRDIGMLGKKTDKTEVASILKRAGSLTEEVLESRKKGCKSLLRHLCFL